MNLSRSIFKTFGSKAIGSLLTFIGVAIFARALAPEQLGKYFLFQGVVLLLALPADLGLRGALEKRMSEGGNEATKLSTTIVIKVVIILFISTLILFFRNRLNDYIGLEVALFIIIGIIIKESYSLVEHLLRGEMKVERAAELSIIRKAVWLLSGLIMIFIYSVGVHGIIYAFIIGGFVALVWGIHLCETVISTPSLGTAFSLIDYAKYDAISGIGSSLFNWIDILIIGYFLSSELVSAYEIAWQLSSITILLSVSVRTAIFPQFSAWSDQKKFEQIERTLTKSITLSLLLVVPAFIGGVLLSENLLTVIYGSEYSIAVSVFVVLMGVRLIQTLGHTVGRTLQAIGYPNQAAYATITGGIINIIFNVILVWLYGILGAAIGTLLAYIILEGLRFRYLKNHIDVNIDHFEILGTLLSSIIMGGAIYYVKNKIIINSSLRLTLVIMFGASLFFIIILASSTMRNNLFELVNMLRQEK